MKWRGNICLITLIIILCVSLAVSTAVTEGQIKTDADGQFLQDAYSSSSWLMILGDLALKQAASGDVKEFSRRMIEDQEKINQNLKRISDRKGIKLEADRDHIRQNTTSFLSKEYGAAFDRQYMSLMMDEHQRNVVLYKEEIEKGRDGDVKAFAGSVLGKLDAYYGKARNILANIPQPFLK